MTEIWGGVLAALGVLGALGVPAALGAVVGILGAALLFALFGLVTRERRGGCGSCSCATRTRGSCSQASLDGVESTHGHR